jgi:antirestriction protein ArdC
MRKPNPNRERAQSIARQIANMTEEQKAIWLQRAPVLRADGSALSGKNNLLAMMQLDSATMVAGFDQWLKLGRAVRKGSAALYIFAPSRGKSKAEAEPAAPGKPAGELAAEAAESVRFLMVPVFDISQTDAVPAEGSAAAA